MHRLDQRRAAAGARALDRLARRLVHGEDVEPVDAHAGDAVADRFVGERLGARLRLDRRRDRPAVVVADEHHRRVHHGREVDAFVERALARRAVAEERHRDRVLAAQLLPPGEPGRVRQVRRDRDADRRDVPVGRVPPARRMAAPPLQDRLGGHAAHEPDRRLAVGREDPVVVRERERRARLDRLVVPEDRVGADPALPVVDDGALVVGAQEHHAAVQLEEIALCQAVRSRVGIQAPEGVSRRHAAGNLPEAQLVGLPGDLVLEGAPVQAVPGRVPAHARLPGRGGDQPLERRGGRPACPTVPPGGRAAPSPAGASGRDRLAPPGEDPDGLQARLVAGEDRGRLRAEREADEAELAAVDVRAPASRSSARRA